MLTKSNKPLTLLVVFVVLLASCSKTPQSCFVTDRDNSAAKVGQEVLFNGTCSSDADSFLWDFGDGASAYGYLNKHVYSAVGNYAVTLVVTSKEKTSSLSRTLTITE